jgi:hypothetical protein
MKLETEVHIKYSSLNFLEERVCEPVWDLLYQNMDKLPKNAKIKITLEFTDETY